MELKDKIKFALDEARILVLGGQVVIGFGYQSVFQPGFEKLPRLSQYLELGSLALLLVALALVLSPAARDALVERGTPTLGMHRYTTRMVDWGLLPFAIGLGVSIYVAVRIIAGTGASAAAGTFTLLLAMSSWYGARLVSASPTDTRGSTKESEVELKDKISHALTETRIVLPGVQATLGFQFIGMLTDSFERLPSTSKYVHLISLGLSALTIILLITPAAFHRVVEHGEATQRQHRVTTAFLIAAMVTLPPAITGDLFVVFAKVTGSRPFAVAVSAAALGMFYGFWFVPGLVLRSRKGLASS